MPEFANLPIQDLTTIWERQAQKLVESGVPRDRVADSLRIAALNFETRTLTLAAQQLVESFRTRSEHKHAVLPREPAPPDAPMDESGGRDSGVG